MLSLPGWDSIERVTACAKWFQIASLVAGVLIAAFGVLAYAYGNRKDTLVEAARTKREAESKHQLDEARTEVDRMKLAAAPRHLSEQEKSDLAKFLVPLSKGKFTIKASLNAKDARGYADEIAAFFNDSKIGWTSKWTTPIITGSNVVGIWITVQDAEAAPESARILQNAFKAAGLSARGEVSPTGPAADEVWLSIGSKN